jgi:hypothetical protein
MNGKLQRLACSVILALTMGLGGCITMPDGTSEPDYVMIEFGSVAAFTVIVNETEVSDESVVQAYEGLSAMEEGLLAVVDGSREMDLSMIDAMFANAVPLEYKALASTGSKLIRQRVKMYMDVEMPDTLPESELTAKISLAVVQGAKAAIGPKYHALKK